MVGRLEICRASQANRHYTICCAFDTFAKRKMMSSFGADCIITYRAILNIGLYNWLLQTGLLKLRFCITAYLYRDIHYHAVAPDVKLYTYTPIHLYTYTSISPIHLYPRYIHKCYNPIQIYLL